MTDPDQHSDERPRMNPRSWETDLEGELRWKFIRGLTERDHGPDLFGFRYRALHLPPDDPQVVV